MKDNLKNWLHRLAMLALVSVFVLALAYTFPADMALLLAVDLSLYFEAVVTVFVVARVKPTLTMARLWLMAAYGRILGRTASRRSITAHREKPKPANDDEDGAFAWPRALLA